VGQSAPQIFSPVTLAQYETLIQRAQAAGIALTGDSGTASRFGVEVTWNYSAETQKLEIQCLSTPFFVKAADVDAKIRSVVTEALG
jgi:hypothetical protein